MSLRYTGKKSLLSCNGTRGFTLIEVLIALAIGSLIAVGATHAITQLLVLVPKAQNSMQATSRAQTAGYWIERDGSSAQIITPSDNLSHSLSTTPLVISFVNWDATKTTITYSVDANHLLQRQVVVTNEKTGVTISSSQAPVADSIASITAQYAYPPGNDIRKILTISINAQAGGGQSASDTINRVYKITPRPH